MAASLVELTDVASVDRAARALFGSQLDTRPAVSQSFAVWRAAEDEPLTTININEHAPKSELDWLALHISRARADGIIITGKVLRDEPNLSYSLEADPRWGDALLQWRERRWGICDPPWILILTGRGEIDFDHPVFHGWGRPMIFTSDRAATRKLADAPVPVVSDEAPDIRESDPTSAPQPRLRVCLDRSWPVDVPRTLRASDVGQGAAAVGLLGIIARRTRARRSPGEALGGSRPVPQRNVRNAPRWGLTLELLPAPPLANRRNCL